MNDIKPRGIAKTVTPPCYDPSKKITNDYYKYWRKELLIIKDQVKSEN